MDSEISDLEKRLASLEYANLDIETLTQKLEQVKNKYAHDQETVSKIEEYLIPANYLLFHLNAKAYFDGPSSKKWYEPPKKVVEGELSLWPEALLTDFIRIDYTNGSGKLTSLTKLKKKKFFARSIYTKIGFLPHCYFIAGIFVSDANTIVILPIFPFNKSVIFTYLNIIINQLNIDEKDKEELHKIVAAIRKKDDFYNYLSKRILAHIQVSADPSHISYGAINHEVTHAIFNFETKEKMGIIDTNYISSMIKQALGGITNGINFPQERLDNVREMMETYYNNENLERLKERFSPVLSKKAPSYKLPKLTDSQFQEIDNFIKENTFTFNYLHYIYASEKIEIQPPIDIQTLFQEKKDEMETKIRGKILRYKTPEHEKLGLTRFIIDLLLNNELIELPADGDDQDASFRVKDYPIVVTISEHGLNKVRFAIVLNESTLYLQYKYGLTLDQVKALLKNSNEKLMLISAYDEILARLVHGLLSLENLEKGTSKIFKLTDAELEMMEKFTYKGENVFRAAVAKYRLAREIAFSETDPARKIQLIDELRYSEKLTWKDRDYEFPLGNIKIKGAIPYCSEEMYREVNNN